MKEKIEKGDLAPAQILDGFEQRVPTLLFLGMPLLALLLKLFYLRSGRYYVEHLIFSLHLHTWVFLAFMVGNGWLKLAALGPGWLGTLFGTTLALWMLWYVLAAFRLVYGESWGKTAVKIVPLGLAYAFALVCVTLLIFFGTVAWLAWE